MSQTYEAIELQPRSKALMVGFWCVFAVALIFAVMVQFSISAFTDLFQAFGANIPQMTLIALRYSKVLLILPAILAVPAIIYSEKSQHTKSSQQSFKRLFMAALALLILAIGLMLYALYLPVIEMGSV